MTTCDRCGKEKDFLKEFCNGDYHFCADCAEDWFVLLTASNSCRNWNLELFKWWIKHSPNNIYNPSRRSLKNPDERDRQ